jgi:hypothetical protein
MILEDIPDSRRLYETAAELGKDGASSVGEAVGRWLVGFHRWSNENLDAKMIALAESNGTALKRLRDNAYTKLLEHCRDERVPHAAWQHLTRQDDQVRRVVYGDMSARK